MKYVKSNTFYEYAFMLLRIIIIIIIYSIALYHSSCSISIMLIYISIYRNSYDLNLSNNNCHYISHLQHIISTYCVYICIYIYIYTYIYIYICIYIYIYIYIYICIYIYTYIITYCVKINIYNYIIIKVTYKKYIAVLLKSNLTNHDIFYNKSNLLKR